jgi:hypothetical protein
VNETKIEKRKDEEKLKVTAIKKLETFSLILFLFDNFFFIFLFKKIFIDNC